MGLLARAAVGDAHDFSIVHGSGEVVRGRVQLTGKLEIDSDDQLLERGAFRVAHAHVTLNPDAAEAQRVAQQLVSW